ncbi:MAG: UvrD-helicase domain-containing protein [Cytophagales bacterium]|nr:UvrD-helicase domain-containing protein [Cytophagales bacterium]MDW8384602.1 UvrD-helicase domain-containing protein [Flammeovirgaceae bacterium]
MNYLDTLNPSQRSAVEHIDGPLMVIAGAGSGKTRVLTYRIAYLIGNGIEPFHILALTFTNKASKEMRDRIQKIVGHEAKNIWMGTFHSVFAKILRIEGEKLGYTSNFTIYDTEDAQSVLKDILKEWNLDDKLYKPSYVYHRISKAKNALVSWKKYLQSSEWAFEDEKHGRHRIGEIYKEYASRCFKANAMDFDDLLFNTNLLISNFEEIRQKYQQKFQYILIDEFQDTNISQYSITRMLADKHCNICVVGDDAQSIYSFRGANIENILNFQRDYPNVKIIKLEQNYRSTQNIVCAANSVIKHNKFQLEKKVWTANEKGEKIRLLKANNEAEEARLIALSIFEEKNKRGLSNNHFAILYRTNAQSRALEEALRRLNIKYKIIGGMSFYQRKEIKDMIAYLRFSVNPLDEEAFKRIVNYPKRGIGENTIEKLLVTSHEKNIPFWNVLQQYESFFGKSRISQAINEFVTLIKSFQIQIQQKDAYEAALYIAKMSGVLRELYEDKTPEGKVRYENVQELLNSIKAFTDSPENTDKSLTSFLQQIALVSTADTELDQDAVTLMTIHASKGLEFKNVYVVGLEENLFPSQTMIENREDLEEERRLFYVAITRAEQKLTLSYALQRYRNGKLVACEPSRFLFEIDNRYIEKVQTVSSFSDFENSSPSKFSTQSFFSQHSTTPSYVHIPSPSFKPASASELRVGMRVEHQKFGFGIISEIDHNNQRAKVLFEHFGEKTLILSYAKLMIHLLN